MVDGKKSYWDEVKQFFNGKLNWVEYFALEHDLFVEKYYHEFPEWSLRFKIPKGGTGQIELVYTGEIDEIEILSSWCIDEYKEFTRYLKWGKKRIVPSSKEELKDEIMNEIKTITNWERKDLNPHRDYKSIWGRYSESEFDTMTQNAELNLKYFKE